MTLPTPHTVGWHTASDGAEDAHGNPITAHTPALNVAGTSVSVIGWAPTRQVETSETRVESDYDLYVPPGVVARPRDVVDLPVDKSLGQFEVVAFDGDWNYGPFGYAPGSVVKLKRTQA